MSELSAQRGATSEDLIKRREFRERLFHWEDSNKQRPACVSVHMCDSLLPLCSGKKKRHFQLRYCANVCQSLVAAACNGEREDLQRPGDTQQHQCLHVSPFDLQRCSRPVQHREALRLAVAGADLRLVFGEARHATSSGQDHQGVPRHAPELEGERPVEDHDEHAVDPLKDGGGVLQGEALLAEENSTW